LPAPLRRPIRDCYFRSVIADSGGDFSATVKLVAMQKKGPKGPKGPKGRKGPKRQLR